MSAASAACPHCGHNKRHAQRRSAHEAVKCAGCRGVCDIVVLGESQLDLCRVCQGLWFDRDELREFGDYVSTDELHEQVAAILRELRTNQAHLVPATYLKCPVCAVPMDRQNYARVSGIILHTCPHHGSWADHAASLRLVELLGEGGGEALAKIAEQREQESRDRTIRHLEERYATLAAQTRTIDLRSRFHLMLDWFDFF
jgi:Zn-finger nucleic acid-binding protein